MTSHDPVTASSARKNFGTFTATIEGERDFHATEVLLLKFAGEEPGGIIMGSIPTISHLAIGFPPGIDENKEVKLRYPDDFPPQTYVRWSYSYGTSNHFAKTGTITITLTSNSGVSRATGVFDFITTEQPPRKVSGTFDASR
ncbi:hypothetical protein J2X84_001305 [Pseudomonas corrugata]|uniref:hypothetical protein n=1 Tax=Pseudomonas corrugata TaxID=47879 RepID=UPI00285A3D93|nr:hypothetical protein [Pseudomonas corrugata]MDR7282484.1 hypothetical protein [Pseudomonas corrugata]